jgi:capsular polysaccharide transport system permease protein
MLAGEATKARSAHGPALSELMGSYDAIESERRFAEYAYQHALAALDQARLNADRQQVYLAPFVTPALPQQALYPERLKAIGTVALVAFALWAIGGLILQSVRDHL